jgi:hypothetical protein
MLIRFSQVIWTLSIAVFLLGVWSLVFGKSESVIYPILFLLTPGVLGLVFTYIVAGTFGFPSQRKVV